MSAGRDALEPYEPEERCSATRGPRSKVRCEKAAKHWHIEHAARGADGRWFFWTRRKSESGGAS